MTSTQAAAARRPVAPTGRNADGVDPGGGRNQSRSDSSEQSRWMPNARTLIVAALVGAAAGAVAALWVTVAQGLGL